jgi:APA family basic amino acid/polyamine antiporter
VTDAAPPRATPLARTLSGPLLTLYGVGAILGAGIYSVLGAAVARAGEAVWLSFLLSGALAGLTALSYAELATTFPRAGGEYVYVRNALPGQRWLARTAGLMLVASAAATAATVSLAFAGYLAELTSVPRGLASFALLASLTALAMLGIRQSVWAAGVLTAIEATGLAIVIGAGAETGDLTRALGTPPTAGVASAAALAFFAYLGFENIVTLAEEARQPERTLPRAILGSVVLATALYLGVALAVVALAPPALLAASDAPLATALASATPRAAAALAFIALCATANTALAALVAGSRLLYGMASGGDLPRALGRVGRSRHTPWLASLIVAVAAAALLPLGSVSAVASLSSFASLVAFASVHAALIALRWREPARRRPFRVPFAIGRLPVLPALGACGCAALLTQLEGAVLTRGGLLLALLLGGSWLAGRRRAH